MPLIWDGEVIGLLFVADRYHRMHTAQSISILSTLATHGAVALKNANDFKRANAALAKAEQARAELERHVRSIQAAAEAHEQMTSLLARGASLSTLCQSVAQLLGGSVLVLDEAGHVVSRGAAAGYAASGSQADTPHGVRSVEMARALSSSRQMGRSVLAYVADGESCRVMAVIGGDDVLGSMALFHRGELDDISIRTFERSSSVIGIVLLSQERMEATKSRGASTLLRSLVSPRQDEPALLANQAERHGVDLGQPLSLMLIEMDGPSAGYAARRFRTLTPLENVLVDDIDGVLVTLCVATRALDVRQRISSWARLELGAPHRGVLSRPVSGPAEVPALVRDPQARAGGAAAHRRARSHRRSERAGPLFDPVRDPRRGKPVGLPRRHHRRADLARPQAHFRAGDHAPDLLRQQPERQAHGAAAADSRQHGRQRLATIEDLLGHWGNASRALEIHIALRLWSLRPRQARESGMPGRASPRR